MSVRQWDGAEYAWQANRPVRHRVPLPVVGDLVLYRPVSWSPDLYECVVTDVQDMASDEARTDPNVRDKVTNDDHTRVIYGPDGAPLTRLRADPWPWIHVRRVGADGQPYGSAYSCREARLEGSAGWLPFDHERRERPGWAGGELRLPA